jgi:hypothetical protein
MKSWKTTTTGALAIIAALASAAQLLLDGNPATNPDYTAIGAAVMAGIGLMSARDANVSSEQQGVK